MNIHQTIEEGQVCPCGAVISEDAHSELCAKCRSRARWARRAEGRQRHSRSAERQYDGARRSGGRS